MCTLMGMFHPTVVLVVQLVMAMVVALYLRRQWPVQYDLEGMSLVVSLAPIVAHRMWRDIPKRRCSSVLIVAMS